MSPHRADEKRKIYQLAQENLKELFQTIIMNLLQEVTLIKDNISGNFSEELEATLDKLDQRNDNYSEVVHTMLLQRIFLNVDKYDLQLVYESFEAVMDKIQRIGHRIGLIELPNWVNTHLLNMISNLYEILVKLSLWFKNGKQNLILNEIHEIENNADIIHRSYLRKLYKNSMPSQVFSQAEFVELTIEDSIDEVERLAQRIFVILHQLRAYSPDPPSYLS